MTRKSRTRQARKQRRDNRTIIIVVVVVGIVLLGVFAVLSQRNSQTPVDQPSGPVGESIPVMPDVSHVEEGTDPGPFNSDPPTSGRHYAVPANAGFYDSDPYPSHPEGHLVHSLEHGYVIFWYNCDLVNEAGCSELKNQIKDAMKAGGNTKLIAFPWSSIDVPVVMTSWGRMQKFEPFDPQQALAFIQANRNQAPEPDAP